MRRSRTGLMGALVISALSSVGGVAHAQPSVAEAKPAPKAATASQPVRRDPAGKQGISPFWELLLQGDSAYLARDFEATVTAFRKAITADAKNPLGHYRMGQAQIAKADLAEAQAAYDAGLRFVQGNADQEAKLLFVLADLAEQQKAYDEALIRWKNYGDFVASKPELKGFAATAVERQKRLTEWKQLSEQSAQVRERVQKRLEAAEPKPTTK